MIKNLKHNRNEKSIKFSWEVTNYHCNFHSSSKSLLSQQEAGRKEGTGRERWREGGRRVYLNGGKGWREGIEGRDGGRKKY